MSGMGQYRLAHDLMEESVSLTILKRYANPQSFFSNDVQIDVFILCDVINHPCQDVVIRNSVESKKFDIIIEFWPLRAEIERNTRWMDKNNQKVKKKTLRKRNREI